MIGNAQVQIPESEKESILINSCWDVKLSKLPDKSIYILTWDYVVSDDVKISFYATKKELEDLRYFLNSKFEQQNATAFLLGNEQINVKRRNLAELVLSFNGNNCILTKGNVDCLFDFTEKDTGNKYHLDFSDKS
jgi:hypothetical protein